MLLPSTSQCLLCRGGAFPCRPGGNSEGMDGLGREGQGWNPLLILHSQKWENPTWTGRVNGFRGRGVGCVVWEWVLRAEGLKRSPVSKESGSRQPQGGISLLLTHGSHQDPPGAANLPAWTQSSSPSPWSYLPSPPVLSHHPWCYPVIPSYILSSP